MAAKKPEEKSRSATIPVQFRIEPRQLKALRDVAFKRAQARGTVRIDVSEVAREALDDWLSQHTE